jgi:hypothetical protein
VITGLEDDNVVEDKQIENIRPIFVDSLYFFRLIPSMHILSLFPSQNMPLLPSSKEEIQYITTVFQI